MDIEELSRPDKIVAGTGTVLAVDLLFLPWHSIDLGIATFTRSAVEAPNPWLGRTALVVTVAVVAVTLLRALQPERTLPELPVPWPVATSLAAVASLVLLLAKLLAERDALGIGAWLGVGLAAAMAYGTHLGRDADVAE